MKKTLLATGAIPALSSSFTVNAAENNKPQYLSDQWYQSVNVVGSYYTRFGPQLHNDTYLKYEAFAKKDWFNFCGYADAPVFSGGDSDAKGIWNCDSPLFMEIESRFSTGKLTNADFSFDLSKEWYLANNYIYDMGCNKDGHQSTRCIGLGTDVDIGLPMSLSMGVCAEYQWQNYGVASENEWDGYCFGVKYSVPIADPWGGRLSCTGFTSFDWGSDLGDDSGYANNGTKTRTNNSIVSSHILALNYDHWHYPIVARYWHNGGQWNGDAELNFGNGNFNVRSTGWGGYLIAGYGF